MHGFQFHASVHLNILFGFCRKPISHRGVLYVGSNPNGNFFKGYVQLVDVVNHTFLLLIKCGGLRDSKIKLGAAMSLHRLRSNGKS